MQTPDDVPWVVTGPQIGDGGQGLVLPVRLRNEPTGPMYAMKVLRNDGQPRSYERFAHEVQALAKVDSPYVMKVVDSSVNHDGFRYYVMELHDGAESLHNRICSGTNPFYGNPIKSLELFAQLAAAMHAYGNAGIVHRDLSPANILVLKDESIRVIDFGICQIEDGTSITLLDENLGTRNYAAPECEIGSTTEIRIQADIYSAGKVLWTALTGEKVFSREAPAFNHLSIRKKFPSNPATWHLQRLIAGSIRRDPTMRFPSPEVASHVSSYVRRLIMEDYLPIELVDKQCPMCGLFEVDRLVSDNGPFVNAASGQYVFLECKRCGYVFVFNASLLQGSKESLFPTGEF